VDVGVELVRRAMQIPWALQAPGRRSRAMTGEDGRTEETGVRRALAEATVQSGKALDAMADRDNAMLLARELGASVSDIAEATGLPDAAVAQILDALQGTIRF
jgi:hypothetical protein